MDVLYQQQFYIGYTTSEIEKAIIAEGFKPMLISNEAGYIYPLHKHIETKLLVFLDGDMQVQVGGDTFYCSKGDRLMIPGTIPHSAVVGKNGCTFFWSEKML